MTVPTVTVKGLRHSLHLCTPGRVDLPLSLVMRSGSALPQCGQTGPLGHNRPSKCSRAASSSWKIGLVRSTLDLLMTHSLRSEEHTSELQSLMRISYAVFCLKKKKTHISTKHSATI